MSSFISSFLNTDIIHRCIPRNQTPFCCPSAYPIGKYYQVQTPIRCYKCINNPESSDDSARIQYDTQKRIQKTVMVPSSLYTHDLASVTTTPTNIPPWNNMSDRVLPHVQKKYNTMILSTYRPGSLSPGGIGCDVKHNSYVRYLNRIKGKSALRKDPIPNSFGKPIVGNNCVNPIYGNKQVKTSIISCPSCRTLSEINTTPQSINNEISYYQPYHLHIFQ